MSAALGFFLFAPATFFATPNDAKLTVVVFPPNQAVTISTFGAPPFNPYLGMFQLDLKLEVDAASFQLERPMAPIKSAVASEAKKVHGGHVWTVEVPLRAWWGAAQPRAGTWKISGAWTEQEKKPVPALPLHLWIGKGAEPAWGPVGGNLRTRLVPEKAVYKVGEALRFVAEFNALIPKAQPAFVDRLLLPAAGRIYSQLLSLEVRDEKGKLLKYHPRSPNEQPLDQNQELPLVPGQIFQHEIDATKSFEWKPGEYELRLRLEGWTFETHFPRYWTGKIDAPPVKIRITE